MVSQSNVINRLKSGETLVHVIENKGGKSFSFQYLSGGGRVTSATYAKLTNPEGRLVEPVSFGLFPDAEPQEWRWRGEHDA